MIIVIDSLNVFFRHYRANPSMSQNGQQTGGIVGYLNNIKDLALRFNPEQIIAVWEGGGSRKRRLIDPFYKGGRKAIGFNRYYEDDIPDTVDNRNYQIKTLVNLMQDLPIKQMYIENCEGDDTIAWVSRQASIQEGKDVVIVSSDRDYYQLINENVKVWSSGRRKLIDTQACIEEFGVSTSNFCLAKAIVGDDSDEVIGVKGAGYKTISKRFPFLQEENEYSLDDILAKCSENLDGPKVYRRIYESADLIRKNIRLVSLDSGNIPASIVKKISYSYSTADNVGQPNKMSLYRKVLKEGMGKFDVNSLFSSVKRNRIC